MKRSRHTVVSPAPAPGSGIASSAELELLLLCGRVRRTERSRATMRTLLGGPIDWVRFRSLAAGHRMLALVNLHLRDEPGAVPLSELEWLREQAQTNARIVLLLTGELLRVLEMLREAGVPAVPYKGPVLAMQLYGDLALRPAGDLDILVRKADVPRARELLMADGYTDRYGLTSPNVAFRLAHRYCEDFLGPHGIRLDLHWAFTNGDVPFPLTLEELTPRLETIRLGDEEVPAFSREDLLLILCVHGAKHRWDRLEWICGVSELLDAPTPLDWDQVLGRAARLRSVRTLLLGVLLAHDLLEASVVDDVVRKAKDDRWALRLVADVRGRLDPQITRGGPVSSLLSHNMFQLPLQDGVRDWSRYLLYRLTTPNRPTAWRTLSVGPLSVPVHAVTWPLRLVWRLLQRSVAFVLGRKPSSHAANPS
jgi:hypothetical protein